jgi:predicted signal transduction protein with EAL and GGDEF domain
VTIGIVVREGAHADFARMYHDADAALYQAREDGKGRIGVFKAPEDDDSMTDRGVSNERQRYALPFA